ncbi:MAG: hypothetical protein A2163_00830 [Actinobacteria bacterium RBG_13_35_12]|nr:MAG: hypothetical protein A2163_00830 [Actinobacteria bacterium RBG_13_35_12]
MEKAQFNTILDYFDEKHNSKSWPSTDLNDSPCNDFKCKLCDYVFHVQIYGSFTIGIDDDRYRIVKQKIIEHLAVRHEIYIPFSIIN